MKNHFPIFCYFPTILQKKPSNTFQSFMTFQILPQVLFHAYIYVSQVITTVTLVFKSTTFSSHKILAQLIIISRLQNDALHHSTWSIPCVRRPAQGYSRVNHENVRFGGPPWMGEGERRQSSSETSCHTHHQLATETCNHASYVTDTW